ncbi:hypothetical protein [Aquisphaera giovannonii]|nr:hypothetical protein [Aquisphaera giovannonii]
MMNLPVVGTLGIGALLLGPVARLPIDLGAWLAGWVLDRLPAARDGGQAG